MLNSCTYWPGPCTNNVLVVNVGESGDMLADDTFPKGGAYCDSCTAYVCKDHTSKNFRKTCTWCEDSGFGEEKDRIEVTA